MSFLCCCVQSWDATCRNIEENKKVNEKNQGKMEKKKPQSCISGILQQEWRPTCLLLCFVSDSSHCVMFANRQEAGAEAATRAVGLSSAP